MTHKNHFFFVIIFVRLWPWPCISLRDFLLASTVYFFSRFSKLSLGFAFLWTSFCFFLSLAFWRSCHLCEVRTKDILLDLLVPFLTELYGHSRISFNQWQQCSYVERDGYFRLWKSFSAIVFSTWWIMFRFIRVFSKLW